MTIQKKIVFREVTIDDANILLRWRNDPITRTMSRDTGNLHIDAHTKWLSRSIQSSKRKLVIAEIDNKPIGVIRSDLDNNIHEISWTIAPEERGKGFGKIMVSEFIKTITGVVCANIKAENEASIKLAMNAGMELITQENGMLHFRK